MGLVIKIKNSNYDVLIGIRKTLKNAAIFLLPSLIAYTASVPQQYAALLGALIYFIKNGIENSK